MIRETIARLSSKLRAAVARVTLVAIVSATALSLHSCAGGALFDEFVSIPEGGWPADSLAVFRPTVEDTTKAYDVSLMVRNDNSYAFANIWLFVDIVSPDGLTKRDTLECVLANADGSWLGAGWGSFYTARCPYLRGVTFRRPGPYTFRVIHGMRTENLQGIHDIGICIEESNNEVTD